MVAALIRSEMPPPGLVAALTSGSSAVTKPFAAARTLRRPCHTVELHHLPTGTIAVHQHTDASLARAVSRAEATARDMREAERSVEGGTDPDDAFPTAPSTLCSYCDFRRVCPGGIDAPVKQPWSSIEITLQA